MTRPAPLVDTPEAPIPIGGSAEWFTGAGGLTLRAALFSPADRTTGGAVRGSVVLSPGRTEPIERYFETVQDLMDRGFVVLVHDWRGQGLSDRLLPDRLKGHAVGMAPFLADYDALLTTFEARLPKPWIAMGHSMGGALTALALGHGEDRFAAAILSAPMFGIQTGGLPRWIGRTLAFTLSRIGLGGRYLFDQPGDPLGDSFEKNRLTHDPVRYARNVGQILAEPKLGLGSATWGWVDFAFEAAAFLAKAPGVEKIAIPVVVMGAEQEALVDNAAQRAATARMPKGRWLEAPGAYHEILQETDEIRAVFWQAFDALTETLVTARP